MRHALALVAVVVGLAGCFGAGPRDGPAEDGAQPSSPPAASPGGLGAPAPADAGLGENATVAASQHECVLLDDGAVRCWGENDAGQLGQGQEDHD